jgi:tetratricopeptide (TPR) repeat protein
MSRRPLPWQAQGALVPAPALFSLVSLQHVDLILSIALTLVGIAVVVALGIAFWRELANDTITISPIFVPRDLAERGYEPPVVAARLLDAYRELHAESGAPFLRRRTERAAGEPDIQLPGGRTSMRGIVRYLRRLFGRPAAEVDGEVTREGNGYVLRLRFRGARIIPIQGERAPNPDVATVLRGAAEDLMLMTDPGTLGLRVMQVERAGGEFTLAARAFEHAMHSDLAVDRARGFLGFARIRETQGRMDEAEAFFKRAIAEGAASRQVVHLYLLMLLEQGRVDDAIAEATRLATSARST